MKIITKYNVGQQVYFLHNNKITKFSIGNIRTFHSSMFPEGQITYAFGDSSIGDKDQNFVFASKEELIDDLK